MASSASITWLGHATYRLTLPDERVILIDPWLKDNPKCPEDQVEQPRCDFIALTHGHSDHAADVARLIEQHDPQVVATIELCTVLGTGSPKARFAPMNIGGSQTLDGVTFSLTRAYHSSSIDSESGPVYTGMPCGLVVNVPGRASFYHAGDTDVFGDMRLIAELLSPEIVARPIGDHFTMGSRGAALAAKFLAPAYIIPMHYGTFPVLHGTVEALREALDPELRDRLVVPVVGESMTWSDAGVTL